MEAPHGGNQTVPAGKSRWSRILLVFVAISVVCFLAQFLFKSLSPAVLAIFLTMGAASLVGALLGAIGLCRPTVRRQSSVVVLVYTAVTVLLLAYSLMTFLELRRAAAYAVCRVKLQALFRAIEMYREENGGQLPDSVKELRGHQMPYLCPTSGREYVLNHHSQDLPDSVLAADPKNSHDSYWFRGLLRTFKPRQAINWGNYTTEELLDFWINDGFGHDVRGRQALLRDGSTTMLLLSRESSAIAIQEKQSVSVKMLDGAFLVVLEHGERPILNAGDGKSGAPFLCHVVYLEDARLGEPSRAEIGASDNDEAPLVIVHGADYGLPQLKNVVLSAALSSQKPMARKGFLAIIFLDEANLTDKTHIQILLPKKFGDSSLFPKPNGKGRAAFWVTANRTRFPDNTWSSEKHEVDLDFSRLSDRIITKEQRP